MKLYDFDDMTVRITLKDGDRFDGECTHNSPEYTELLCGRENESLSIDGWIFELPDIASVEIKDEKTGFLWMGKPAHRMKLFPEPFAQIENGRKTYELRLYDEKRSKMRVGDIVRFECTDEDGDVLYAEIRDILIFPSFEELYRSVPLTQCGYTEETAKSASPKDMEAYYSPEKQKQYGVCAIRIEVL